MTLKFNHSAEMTLGVELEMQILDKESKALTPGAPMILDRLGGESAHIKPELFQSTLEINTGICKDTNQVRADLERAIGDVRRACDELGFELASAGSNPVGRYTDRIIYPKERYFEMIDRNRWVVQRMVTYGVHIHVGMRDGDHAMAMINAMMNYLPHVLALSASSPYWQGKDTGLASSRTIVFEALPTAGHPCTYESWKEFQAAYEAMRVSKAIQSIKDIWWDVRPHPDFGTVELRVCDSMPTVSETVAVVAFVQVLYAWLDERHRNGETFPALPSWVLRENKWRASRWGVEAEIVIDTKGHTRLLRTEIEALIKKLAPYAAKLNCTSDFERVATMISKGLSYDRQRALHKETRSLQAVSEALVEEFRTDKPIYVSSPKRKKKTQNKAPTTEQAD